MTSLDQENSPDIDKGWALVVATCAFFNIVFTFGVSSTIAIFYANFLDEFEESPVTTAWVLNLNLFCSTATSFFANCFLIIIGPRLTLIVAGLLSTAGMIASSFENSSIGILRSYGLLAGSGFGFSYFAAFAVIPNYFRKYRILATAFVSTGVSVGLFINPPFIRFLIEKYHWRGAFIVLGGINLNVLVLAAAIIPPRQENKNLGTETGFFRKSKKAISAVRAFLSGIFLLKNPLWCLFSLTIVLLSVGLGGFLTHIYNFARSPRFGFSTMQVTLLSSTVGIASIFGRFLIGAITQAPKVHVMMMFILCCALHAIGNIAISFVDSYWGFVFCCLVCGFSFGWNSIYFEAVIHVLGLDLFGTGLSYTMIFSGLGLFLGGPFAAWIYEQDPSYAWSFRALGICAIVGIASNLSSWLTIKDGKIQQRKSYDELKQVTEIHAQDYVAHL